MSSCSSRSACRLTRSPRRRIRAAPLAWRCAKRSRAKRGRECGLKERNPEAQLSLILGADMAATLPSWREPRRIIALAQIAVAPRREGDQELQRALAKLGTGARIADLPMRPLPISSTEVRARLARGEDVSALVGRAVAGYIAAHHLYAPARRAEVGAGPASRKPAQVRC
jgi:hypothetical protein